VQQMLDVIDTQLNQFGMLGFLGMAMPQLATMR
jgi:hypothetical protein